MRSSPRVIIIGLDSMPPAIAFEHHAARMPNLTHMRDRGCFGSLRSTDPPVTIPAWVTMTSGEGPGELGIYGFRARETGSYLMRLVGPSDVKHQRIWASAAAEGKSSVVVSVPLTYPVPRVKGVTATGCFLTPSHESEWSSPAEIRDELTRLFGRYMVDVEEFRTDDTKAVLDQCRALSRQHFAIFRHLIETREPDFAMLVDLGPDRFHHAMLRHAIPWHPGHDSSHPMVERAAEYYTLLDEEIGKTLKLAGNNTVTMVVSDHGVKPLTGSVCVNELLAREGYLVLDEFPSSPTPLSRCKVDWSRTRAWGEGGYHSRIFFNVEGREPLGIVSPLELGAEKEKLKLVLEALRGPGGTAMRTRVHDRDELYGAEAIGDPPDLTVYWDDLSMRSAGTVGRGGVFIKANDTGPDDANHDPFGIFVMTGTDRRGELEGLEIADVHAIAMEALGLK